MNARATRHRYTYRADHAQVTARSEDRHGKVTRSFLDRHFGGVFETIVFADQEGHNLSKGELARHIGAQALIDDLPAYVLDAADHGIPCCT